MKDMSALRLVICSSCNEYGIVLGSHNVLIWKLCIYVACPFDASSHLSYHA